MIDPRYKAQVDLLLQAIPFVAKEKDFALKGGTAINLFIRDMPRLSVDIDLTYLPVTDRETALAGISNCLGRIRADLEKSIPGISVTAASREGQDVKINCQIPGAQIKIEVNTTTRGHIYPVRILPVSDKVQDEFGRFAVMNIISRGELYGGKICAALDRQHPRDLFDVWLLLENEGYTEEIKYGFLVSLLSHMRPLNEVIKPNFIDSQNAFATQFAGMTTIPFSYVDYEMTRNILIREIHQKLTDHDRQFLIGFKKGHPDWSLFPVEHARNLPAIQWKLHNIQNLIRSNPQKHREAVAALEAKLSYQIP